LAVYLVDWQSSDALGEKRVKYAHAGVEAVHCLSNPNTDNVGSAVYGEVKVGDWVMAWQGKGPSLKESGTVEAGIQCGGGGGVGGIDAWAIE